MTTFTYTPSDKDRVVSVTIPKALDPLFVEFYQATKREDDTPEAFAYRILLKEAVKWKETQALIEAQTLSHQASENIMIEAKQYKKDNELT